MGVNKTGKEPKAKKKMGRPSKYSEAIADEICARIASGETVLRMCEASDHLPDERQVYRWLFDKDKEYFRRNYNEARRIQAERMAEELADIADNGRNDYMERLNAEGEPIGVQADHEHIQRSKLRVDTRKWIAARLLPKKYGDKIQNEHSGKIEQVNVVKYEE